VSEKKVRVLVVCNEIAPGGGPAGYTYNLREGLRELQLLGDVKHTWSFFGNSLPARNRAVGVTSKNRSLSTILLGFSDWLPTPVRRLASWYLTARNRALRQSIQQSTVVVFQGYQTAGRLRYAQKSGKHVVYMPHSPSIQADEEDMMSRHSGRKMAPSKFAFIKDAERRSIRYSNCVVFPSRNAGESYFEAFGPELQSTRVAFIGSGIVAPTAACDFGPREKAGSPTVLFVGRYVEHKGYDLYTDAAYLLTRAGIDANFLSMGAGPMKCDTTAVTDLGWSDAPHDVVKSASLVVIPNRLAYFDLLPLEVAALGRALIMTKVGGNIDQLELLPDSLGCDVDGLGDCIIAGLARLDNQPDWGARNREAFDIHFSASKMASRWEDFIFTLGAD
jgi:glycosyltransferase involved in cell wall biosynthesis